MGVGLLELQLIALEFATAFDLTVVSQVPAPRPKPSVTLIPPEIRIEAHPRGAAVIAAAA